MQVQIQPLSSIHNCKGFDCGTPPLNEWLATMARQQQKKNIARTFVLVDVAVPETILGFYTLAVSEVGHENFPNPKKFPKRVPVIKLGRFATLKTLQRKGLGGQLLLNALEKVAELSLHAGIAAIVVDAKDSKAAAYYREFGFLPSPENPLQLFLLTATLQAVIAEAGQK
jgi:GNAT superfamily N-acetyltransferase